ncbi:MAG: polyprenol monophosphomannose synthase [Anaerolineales bacterium]|nr:polyprenol monophosphomannose synthase [Anaerolineales bacterium]
MKTTVIIPTYNEAENLRGLAEQLWALPLPLSLIVVDDASPDGTGQIADEIARQNPNRFSIIHRPGLMGLGTAYVAGFQQALASGAEAIVQMDADFSHSPSYLPEMVTQLAQYDVVVGSRYTPGGGTDKEWGLGRKMLSSWANFYARNILGLRTYDATAGFRAWRSETLRGLGLDRIVSNGYVFQVELTYLTERLGYHTLEVPIYFEDRRIGRSKMSMKVKLEAAFRVWQVAWRHHLLTHRDRRA